MIAVVGIEKLGRRTWSGVALWHLVLACGHRFVVRSRRLPRWKDARCRTCEPNRV